MIGSEGPAASFQTVEQIDLKVQALANLNGGNGWVSDPRLIRARSICMPNETQVRAGSTEVSKTAPAFGHRALMYSAVFIGGAAGSLLRELFLAGESLALRS